MKYGTRHAKGRGRPVILLLAVICSAVFTLWLMSWVHYVFIGWTVGHFRPVGSQNVIWDVRDEWGLFLVRGDAAIGWQQRARQGGVISPANLELRKGRLNCFFFVISPIVWDDSKLRWPLLRLDASERTNQLSSERYWAYRRVRFPLVYPLFLVVPLLILLILRQQRTLRRPTDDGQGGGLPEKTRERK